MSDEETITDEEIAALQDEIDRDLKINPEALRSLMRYYARQEGEQARWSYQQCLEILYRSHDAPDKIQ